MSEERIAEVNKRITAALSPTSLEIIDDSAAHAGHPGARAGGGHFTVRIGAEQFEGKTLLACHRLVYDAVGNMMESEIHALSIDIIRA